VKVPLFRLPMRPICRLLFPVIVSVLPIWMLPWVEFEVTQTDTRLTPSVASMAGSSTGQRVNGVQRPGPAWNV
jgi:hypothetical protein